MAEVLGLFGKYRARAVARHAVISDPHAVAGAALANMLPNNPFLGFALAFASHYVLDMIPHKDYSIDNFLKKETRTAMSIFQNAGAALHFLFVVFDFILAIFLCFLFFVRDEKSIVITLIGLVGGILPDFFQFMYYKHKHQPWIFLQNIHDRVHHILVKNDDEKSLSFFIFGIAIQFVLPFVIIITYYLIK